jgi:myo-inositol-1(or 4)-monophosphatase
MEVTDPYLRETLLSALEAASLGGSILKEHWGKLKGYDTKSFSTDLVTLADKESETAIVNYLNRHWPEYEILAEESGFHSSTRHHYSWVVDPLDGTTNYAHQIPIVSVSIALLLDNIPIVGVVYNPILDEKFVAVKGGGATLNNIPIHVSKVSSIPQSVLATGFPYDRKTSKETNYAEFCHLTHISQGVRRMGSAALDLAYVAAGRFDGYWESGLKKWDMAAGVLLVQEAGGLVTAYDQSPFNLDSDRILATNGSIHQALSTELALRKNKL